MAEREVSVKLTAKDQASKVVAGFQGKLRSLGNEATELLRNKLVQGVGFLGLIKGVLKAVDAANEFESSLRMLEGTAKITGTPLAFLQSISDEARNTFKLSAVSANEFAVEMAKLADKAGDVGDAAPALGAFLDIGAARGLSTAQTLKAVQQAILGIDEGTDKLFNKNPSVIYQEFADKIGTTAGKLTDQQKAQALLNGAMEDGEKVRGAYEQYLESSAGKQEQLNIALNDGAVAFGTALLPVVGDLADAMVNVAGGITIAVKVIQDLGNMVGFVVISILDSVMGLGSVMGKVLRGDFKGAADAAGATLATLRQNFESSAQSSAETWSNSTGTMARTEIDFQALLLNSRKTGNRDRTEEDKREADARVKRLKDVNEELLVKTVMYEQGMTEAQAKEYIQRKRDLGEHVGRQAGTIDEAYRRLDGANLLLAAGFDKNVIPKIRQTGTVLMEMGTRSVPPVVDAFDRLAEITGLTREEVEELIASGKVYDREAQNWIERTDEGTEAVKESGLSMADATRAGAGLATGLGLIDDKTANLIQNTATLGDSIKNALAGGLTGAGVVGIIGGLSGVLKGLFGGKSPAQQEAERVLKKNTETIAENSRRVGDLTRLQSSGAQLSGVQSALGGAGIQDLISAMGRAGGGSAGATMQAAVRKALAQELGKVGLGLGDLDEVAKDLGITIKNSEGKFLTQGLRDLLAMLGEIEPTQFADTFAGQRERLRSETDLFDLSEAEQAKRLAEIAGGSLGSGVIGQRLGGLDFSTAEGRAAGIAAIQQLFADLPGMSAGDLGGLTGSDFLDVLKDLKDLLSAEAVTGDTFGEDTESAGVDPFEPDETEGGGLGGSIIPGSDTIGDMIPTSMDIWMSMDAHLATIAAHYAPGPIVQSVGDASAKGKGAMGAGSVSLTFGDIIVQSTGGDGRQVGTDIVLGINEALADLYQFERMTLGSAARS